MKRTFLLLALFILIFQSGHIVLSNPRYYFDMNYYIRTAGRINYFLQQSLNDFSQIPRLLNSMRTGHRPSLYYFPGILFNRQPEFNIKIFLLANSVFYYLIFILLIYQLYLKDSKSDILPVSALFFLIAPLTLNYTRYPMVEFPFYLLNALAIAVFYQSRSLRKYPYWVIFLLLASMGMLIKFSSVFFIIVPAVLMLLTELMKKIKKSYPRDLMKKEIKFRLFQLMLFFIFLFTLLSIFSGKGYFAQSLHQYFQTEVAAYWSYPYITFWEKLWWFITAPTQIFTVPALMLSCNALLRSKKKILIPLVFLLIPLFQFSFFMKSKGARMFGSLSFPLAMLASAGWNDLAGRFPAELKNKRNFILAVFVVLNVFSSGFIPLDHAPAYEFPDGGIKELYKGLTPQLFARGGFTRDNRQWEQAVEKIKNVLKSNSNKQSTVIHLYYTVNLLPGITGLDVKKQVIDELLWKEAQRFPLEVFTTGNSFFIFKTGKYTHWGTRGEGLELESNLRYLHRVYSDPDSLWRKNTLLLDKIDLPDNSSVYIYYRQNDLTAEDKIRLSEEYLNYDRFNGINISMVPDILKFYSINKNPEKMSYWLDWVKKSAINPKVTRLVSLSDKNMFNSVKNKILNNYD